jgi:hypothetical protein
VIQPATGFQEIEVIMLSDSDEAQFIDYVNRRKLTGTDPGVSNIPSVHSLEAVARIIVGSKGPFGSGRCPNIHG